MLFHRILPQQQPSPPPTAASPPPDAVSPPLWQRLREMADSMEEADGESE